MDKKQLFLKYFDAQRRAAEQRIEGDIQKYRMGFVTLCLKDKNGNAVPNAKVTVKLVKHHFKFGCNIFMLDQFPDAQRNTIYKNEFIKLFNYATAPFYWSDYEVTDGNPRTGFNAAEVYRRPAPEKVIRFCKENGIGIKGHPLMWHSFLPDWLVRDREEAFFRMDRRFRELSEAYGNRIRDWDAVNETLICPFIGDKRLPKDYPLCVLRQIERYFGSNRLFINELTSTVWGPQFKEHLSPFYLQLENLKYKGVHLNGIGMQYHLFNEPDEIAECAEQYLNPEWLFAVMDRYADFHLPMQISEVTVPAYAGKDISEAMQQEYREIQAEVTRWLYRIWFSHPAVEAIIWWNLADGTGAYAPLGSYEGENHWGGGLLDNMMQPKPVYHVLDELIHKEWHTEFVTEARGANVDFQGFYGEYEIVVETEGIKHKSKIFFTPDSNKSFDIIL